MSRAKLLLLQALVAVVAIARDMGMMSTFSTYVPQDTVRELYSLDPSTTGAMKAAMDGMLEHGLRNFAEQGVSYTCGKKDATGVMGMSGAEWLVRPERVAEENPDGALDALNLRPGMTIADLGSGVGYMTLRMAKRVGPTGKVYGVPVHRLLGGPTRDRIRVYHTPQAKKIPPGGPYEHSLTPAEVEKIVANIKAARDAVGPGGAVMFDAHCAIPPASLIQLASALKPYDVLFIEEPAVPGNIEVFKRLKEKINIPLAAGERDRTVFEFLPYLQHRCLDVLQPDCCHTGGITSMKKIAVLAETFQTPLAPHCTAGFLGISASLHVAASIPLFLIHEFYPDNVGFTLKGITRMEWKLDKDGYIGLPPGPGLGVEVDEKKLEDEAKRPQTYKWPGAKLKDGSVSDY